MSKRVICLFNYPLVEVRTSAWVGAPLRFWQCVKQGVGVHPPTRVRARLGLTRTGKSCPWGKSYHGKYVPGLSSTFLEGSGGGARLGPYWAYGTREGLSRLGHGGFWGPKREVVLGSTHIVVKPSGPTEPSRGVVRPVRESLPPWGEARPGEHAPTREGVATNSITWFSHTSIISTTFPYDTFVTGRSIGYGASTVPSIKPCGYTVPHVGLTGLAKSTIVLGL